MQVQKLDAGKASRSPSAALMELVNFHHEIDRSHFDDVVKFLEENLHDVIAEVHSFDKLLIDNGTTQLNCPPAPEPGDNHGALLLRTLSEKVGPDGIAGKREFKVHDCGVDPKNADNRLVEIREDTMNAPTEAGQPPNMTENAITVSIRLGN